MKANVQWQVLVLSILNLLQPSEQSIVGITYRDNFDFEERARFRSRYECDPLYWHPLHMPDHCNRMFSDLIRTRLDDKRPLDNKAKKETEIFRRMFHLQEPRENSDRSSDEDPSLEASYIRKESHSDVTSSDRSGESNDMSIAYYDPIVGEIQTEPRPKMAPYFKMLNMVQEDVMQNPAAPVFGILPSLGLSAIYRQSISTKTENMIKKISGAYAKAAQDTYKEMGLFPFYPPPPILPSNNSSNPENMVTDMPPENSLRQKKTQHRILQVNKLQ